MPNTAWGPPGCFPHMTVQINITPGERVALVHGSTQQGESPPASLPRSRSPETGSHTALIYSPIDPSSAATCLNSAAPEA